MGFEELEAAVAMAEQQRTSNAWRWVFDSLRAAADPPSLVPHLLSHAPAFLQSISRIPSREVQILASLPLWLRMSANCHDK